MNPHLSALAADEHRRDLMRAAERHRLVRTARNARRSRPSLGRLSALRLPALVSLRRVRVLPAPCEQP
jgi:hypothetical protein